MTSAGVADVGDNYTATTTGPFNCYKANISANAGSTALMTADEDKSASRTTMANQCCGMTDYYILTGLSFAGPKTTTTFTIVICSAQNNHHFHNLMVARNH